MLDRDALARLRDHLDVPAVGAALCDADGVTVEVLGTTQRGGAERADPQDAWHLGSCTKSLTAAVYARLVETGRADWSARVSGLFPDLTVHPGWADRTAAELLWCRAGVAANLPLRTLTTWRRDTRPLTDQRTAAAVHALGRPPARPGRFVYSNLGYLVLGAAIDRIAGSWETALHTELLDPLGVSTAGFGPPHHLHGHRPRLRVGPLLVGRGAPIDPADGPADNPAVMSSAGTLHLSLADWGRVLRVFQADAPGPLAADTIDRLLAVPDGPGRGMSMGWATDPDGRSGMQGSNTLWSATALMSKDRTRTALVVANDGRSRVLTATALHAVSMLGD